MKKIKIVNINISKIKNNKFIAEIPELYQLKKVVEINSWHNRENVFKHTLTVLSALNRIFKKIKPKIKNYLNQKIDNYTRKDLLFLSALFHDISKKETLIKNNNITMCPEHERQGYIKIKKILNRFDLSNNEKKVIARIIRDHGLIHPILTPQNDKLGLEYRKFKKNHTDIFLELVLLAMADTIKSYLKITNPNEFKFKINFYNNILKRY